MTPMTPEELYKRQSTFHPSGSTTPHPPVPTTPPLPTAPKSIDEHFQDVLREYLQSKTTTPAATGWWTDPNQFGDVLAKLGMGLPAAPGGVDPNNLNQIQATQAQNLIDRMNAQQDKRMNSLAGYLGSVNMNQSGLGIGTLANAENEAYRNRGEVATNLAEVLARNNLDYNKYLGEYGLNRFKDVGDLALGMGQLGVSSQGQQNDLLKLQMSQEFQAGQSALDRAFQMGMLDRQQTFQGGQNELARQHEIEIQKLAATNAQAAQQLDQSFKAGQAEADRQQQTAMQSAQLNQQLQIVLAQLADAAAGRTQQAMQASAQLQLQAQELMAKIQQNEAQNQLTAQGQQNQFALGMGQLQQGAQGQNFGQALSLLQMTREGLNPNNPIAAGLLGRLGMGGGGGPAQPVLGGTMPQRLGKQMDFTQFARNQGVIPNFYGDYNMSDAGRLRSASEAYQQYAGGEGGGQPLWMPTGGMGGGPPQFIDFSQGGVPRQMGMGGGGSYRPGPATTNSFLSSLPSGGQKVYKAIQSGSLPDMSQQDMYYWLNKLQGQGMITQDQRRQMLGRIEPALPPSRGTGQYVGTGYTPEPADALMTRYVNENWTPSVPQDQGFSPEQRASMGWNY